MNKSETIVLETPSSQLVFAKRGGLWTFAHIGARGGDADEIASLAAGRPWSCNHLAPSTHETYPAFGSSRAPSGRDGFSLANTRGALQVRHADGDCSVDWECMGVEESGGEDARQETGDKGRVPRLASRAARVPRLASRVPSASRHVAITYADRAHPSFRAVQHFVAWDDCDVFETWVELRHEECGPVALFRMDSFCLEATGLGDRFHLLSLSGQWASEANVAEDELLRGRETVLGARSGVHDSWENNPAFMLSIGPTPAREESGTVLAGALCWSGVWEIRLRHEWSHELRICAGAANLSGPYILEPGRTLTLPKFVFTWSERGKGAASRALHAWARKHLMPHPGPRKIVLNSWEGTRFALSEERVLSLMDGAKALGAECFVLDDGWFGRGRFARNDAGTGLGDWVEDPAKFPGGLARMAAEAKKRGLAFGLWFEPEMADVESKLVKAHPDWVLQEPGRPLRRQRGGGQVVLDMANPAVRDALFDAISAEMRSIPGLSYVKLDANAEIANFASPWLGAGEKQGNLWFDFTAGWYELMARLRAAFPRIVFQSCASGGGRADFGALSFADEFWGSDNTCAQQRVAIQWGEGLFYPACAIAAHVTDSPNQQTRRVASLKYRFDVAFSGRLGVELRPEQLQPGELEFARRCIAAYKRLRPVIQGGDMYRLASPLEGDHAALLFVSPDRRRAVVAVYGLSRRASDGRLAPLHLPGLDPAARYRLREINLPEPGKGLHIALDGKAFSGAALAAVGIPFNLGPGDDSFVLELAAAPRGPES